MDKLRVAIYQVLRPRVGAVCTTSDPQFMYCSDNLQKATMWCRSKFRRKKKLKLNKCTTSEGAVCKENCKKDMAVSGSLHFPHRTESLRTVYL